MKEDKELDQLIQDILREYNYEIVFSPKKGERQYGVDIYSVGKDEEDNTKKVVLVTVKMGNLDRNNWQGSNQALRPSLEEIIDVFVRNNILPEHRDLPIKIIVALNGNIDPAIQQNWVAFVENNSRFEFEIWHLEKIVNLVLDKLINENIFSAEDKVLMRKIIVFLFNPDYDFKDLHILLENVFSNINTDGSGKRNNIKQLRKVNLLFSIIVSYCEKENDLRLAMIASEIVYLRIWKFVHENESIITKEYFEVVLKGLNKRLENSFKYLKAILPVCKVKDGLSRKSMDSVNYCLIAYEVMGFIALAGLELLHMSGIYKTMDVEIARAFEVNALECAYGVIELLNNNRIVFYPRIDDQIIELNLVFLLLYEFDKKEDISAILAELCENLDIAKSACDIAPLYKRNLDKIFELDSNSKIRKDYNYNSSSLIATLVEWVVVIDDENLYNRYRELVESAFKDIELTLWFPNNETETVLYSKCALPETGYCLSNIKLSESFSDFKVLTLSDFIYNSEEIDFSFMKNEFWTIGLLASRHYRTYVFPSYWRQYFKNFSVLALKGVL